MNTSSHFPEPQQKPSFLALLGFWLGIGLVLFMMFCFFAMQIMNGVYAARLLRGHKTISASVTTSSMTSRSPGSYKFTMNGEEYRGQASRAKRGQRIQIAYLPGNPAVNRPAKTLIFDAVSSLVLLPLIVVIAGWWTFFKKVDMPVTAFADEEPAEASHRAAHIPPPKMVGKPPVRKSVAAKPPRIDS